MGFMDQMKSKADQNRDGRVSKDDLDSMRDDNNSGMIDKLKAKADTNNDSKVSMDDLKNIM